MGYRIDTVATHAGELEGESSDPVVPPISLSTTFRQHAPGHHDGPAYARMSNPNRDALERTLANLEGGSDAATFSSGCAAMHAAFQLLGSGDHIVACADVYGGTYRLVEQLVVPAGVDVTWVDMANVGEVEDSMTKETKMLWIETPTNPLLKVFDIRALSTLAHANEAMCVVDNTFATPLLQRPLTFGADLVVHSMSKYLNGHSDVIAGAIVTSRPEIAERIRFIQGAVGAVPSPFDCYLIARGLKTLPIRMTRHCENAQLLAEWLQRQPTTLETHYPGLRNHAQHALASRQMAGFGGMVSFVVDGGIEAASSVLRRVRLFSLAESLGGVESLIGLPALMSHASMPSEARSARGIEDGLIRLSVGLEDIEDLREDLAQALGPD